MEWKTESFGDWKKRLQKWHRWFAWYPVFIYRERKTVWLRSIDRKLLDYYSYSGTYKWEYRTMEVFNEGLHKDNTSEG